MAQAIAEAALITFVPVFLLKGGPGDSGSVQSLFFFGGTTFTLVVLVANSKVGRSVGKSVGRSAPVFSWCFSCYLVFSFFF